MSTGQDGAGASAGRAEEALPSAARAESERAPTAPVTAQVSVLPEAARAARVEPTGGTAEGRAEARSDRWRRRLRDPETGRPVWWVEILILVALYYCYTGTRGFAEGSVDQATRTGEMLVRWQAALGLDVELGLNHWLQTVPALAIACCYYYATLHFIVTPVVILWMHRRHPSRYSRARWTLAFTTILCLIGFFLFPTAPPRLLPDAGYIDTMAHYSNWGWWGASASAAPHGLDKVANLYAAMPSLHCAWALWCGVLIARNARWRWLRVLGVLYPAATAFVVMATANHYILDAVAGWAVLGVSALAATALARRSARRQDARRPSAPPAGGSPDPAGEVPSPVGEAEVPAIPAADTSAAAAAPSQRPTEEGAAGVPAGQARSAGGGLATMT
ncbi:phosphatase PAP2 family protein [Pseudofrankia asymbiotica]|uniref:Inositol phosphorylceramide synthase n=1 Tax=Pseudofrankia asymbiotica TaxID=1834516 RepID=A0A1V2IHG6_9ACTN|nr:phosphatase PAP2 family protein [Pseudofrankia asymbiotica]ONH31916.1 inositol phosphorylceramide synthase [Pseudofrankia asymbiotica]